jgi:DNA-binding SARP family transcriptional activator/DNA polymerase III delta prime subunit
VEFRILGPLEVVHEGRSLALGGGRERTLLALLLLSANQVISVERLAEDLWAGRPPEGANHALRVYVSRLRKSLREAGGDEVLVTQPLGYVARVEADALDASRFEALVARGRKEAGKGDHQGAAATLREALALWRGPALADLADAPFARAEGARLEEARLSALEERIEADLACGRHGELVAELDALTRAHPLRERLWAQRMVALYRSGRQADALRAYQELRVLLGEELGLEPSAALARLEGAMLRHEPELDWPPAGRAAVSPPAPGSLEGVVTFLFTDLVGSTQLLERLGEDAAEELRRTHFSLLRQAVSEAGGQEVKNLGDGLMVAFASPLAALGCALAVQRGVAEHNRAHPERHLGVRVGLQSGEAVRAEDDFFGSAVVVAKRLCDRAGAGQILAGELVASLVGSRGDFRFRPLGPLALKGLGTPVPGVAVAWQRPEDAEAGPEGGEVGQPLLIPLPNFLTGTGRVFVGREDELDHLRVAWKEAQAGRRRVVLLGGEPGVGKTRLAAVLAEELHPEGSTVLAGRCDEDLGVSYQPMVEALRHQVDHTPNAHLAARLGRFGGELTRLVPELAERAPGLAAPLRSDPETERYRLFDAVAAWLGAVSADQPVLLVLDDLQWAARPTLHLLRHLVRSPTPMRLLVLGTYRDTELGRDHPLVELLADLRRDEAVERLSLSGLDENEVVAVVEGAAGHDLDGEERALAGAIHAETEGNPFFVWEVLRHLTETGAVVRQEGRWVAERPGLGIPEGVRDVVGRRLSRLSEIANGVLSSAAVMGTDFEIGVLRAVCGLDEGELVVALDEAAGARLVEETGAGIYRFVHALVRAALYDTLSATRRTRLHLRVADAYEERGGHDASRLGYHLLAAAPLGEAIRTARACLAAGDRALLLLADAEAGDWYSQGLAFGDEDHGLRIDLLTGLGEAQRRTGDGDFRQTLLDAARLAADQGDVSRLVRAVLANSRGTPSVIGQVDEECLALIATALDLVGPAPSGDRAELLALQATELVFAGDHERVLRAADEAGSIAAHLADVTVRARVGLRRYWACLVPDRVAALAAESTDLVRFADAGGDPQLRVLSRRPTALLAAGDLAEARHRMAEAMDIADETGQPALRSLAGFFYAAVIDALGEHEEAERLTQAAFELGQQAAWPDTFQFYAGRMLVHWFFEGQAGAAGAMSAKAFATHPRLVVYQAAWALGLALTGQDEELAGFLPGLPALLPEVPVDVLWPVTHFFFAAALGFGVENAEAAAALHEFLLPYRSLHAAYGVGYAGPIEVALAIAARVMGDPEGALAHHEAAAATIEACGAARARALNGYQWAVTLLARDAPDDRQRAAELAEETLAYCRTKGYTTFVTKTEELLATI